jgi:hypothetical protein
MELTPEKEPRRRYAPGTVLMAVAALVTLTLAVAQGFVSYSAQYAFVFSVKDVHLPSVLEALGLDTGAVIFALLALARARMGKPARAARALNVACATGSMIMNLLAADLGSPRAIAVYAVPPLLYIAASDQLITTVRQASNMQDSTVWRSFGFGLLYAARLLVALPSTASGLRRWLLQATPLPAADESEPQVITTAPVASVALPASPAAPARRPVRRRKGESKTAVLLRLYAGHVDYGDRSKVSRVASELAPQAGLAPGSARTVLYKHVDAMAGQAS